MHPSHPGPLKGLQSSFNHCNYLHHDGNNPSCNSSHLNKHSLSASAHPAHFKHQPKWQTHQPLLLQSPPPPSHIHSPNRCQRSHHLHPNCQNISHQKEPFSIAISRSLHVRTRTVLTILHPLLQIRTELSPSSTVKTSTISCS